MNVIFVIRAHNKRSTLFYIFSVKVLRVYGLEVRKCLTDRLPWVIIACSRKVVDVLIIFKVEFWSIDRERLVEWLCVLIVELRPILLAIILWAVLVRKFIIVRLRRFLVRIAAVGLFYQQKSIFTIGRERDLLLLSGPNGVFIDCFWFLRAPWVG